MGEVTGSLRQWKPGIWELRAYIGRSDEPCPTPATTFEETKRAAERELTRLVTAQGEKPERVPRQEELAWGPKTTINAAIEGWKRKGWQDLSPNTARGYEGCGVVSPYDVERYSRDLRRWEPGRPLSAWPGSSSIARSAWPGSGATMFSPIR